MLKIFNYAGMVALFFFYQTAHSQIIVATAANMKYAMDDLRADFYSTKGIEVKAVYGSSGKLVTQIKNGAPFDLFVSADVGYADSAVKWGYGASKPKIYAYGKLALWTMKNLDLTKGLSVLADSGIGKIAIGDPKVTVYGPASIEAMKKTGVYDKVKAQFVFADNIAQVAEFIVTQSADIGLTAVSIAMSEPMRGKGTWVTVDSSLYPPIGQAAIILKYGDDNNPGIARTFYEYLYSEKARAILKRFGYSLP
jgi:molybdate transport system substrate-binding protein